jgi:hypothetical protein
MQPIADGDNDSVYATAGVLMAPFEGQGSLL